MISLGFGIVLLLHGGIAVLNHVGLDRAERDFQRYDEMKHRAAAVVDLDRELQALQHHVLMYTQTGHPGPARRVRQVYERARDRIDHQIGSAIGESDRADLHEVRDRLDAYRELFEEVVIDRDRWMHLSDEGLHRLSVEVEGRLAKLADAEVAAGDFEAASQLNLARQRLLLAESAAVQYLLRPETSLVTSTRWHLKEFREALQPLRERAQTEAAAAEFDGLLAVPTRYEGLFLEMVQYTRAYLHLINVVMPGEALELAHLSQVLSDRMVRRVEALAVAMSKDAGRFQYVSNGVSLLTIAMGVLAGTMIRRRVVPPLVEMTDTLGRLAQGDLSTKIPGLDRRDEVGRMAQAAHVFREKTQQTTTLLLEARRLGTKLGESEARYREAAESLGRHNAELKHKNEEMEQFTYAVSHDLKSPLVTCMGLIDCLKEDLAAGDEARVQEWLERLQRSVTRMEANINDLLDLSRAGRARHEPGEIDLNRLVGQVADDLGPRAARIGARVRIEPNLPRVYGDPLRITEVVENLLANALKYGCDYHDPRVVIGARRLDDETRLYVRDNGQGIDPRYHDKVFGLFQRLDRQVDGTGVGLALVAKIMEVHGGRVWVESEPGKGATFWLAFPDKPVAAMALAA